MQVLPGQQRDSAELVGLELAIPPLFPKILVLDDDLSILKLVSMIITRRNLSCETAASLQSARELMKNSVYDILFLDLRLPDGCGTDLLEENLHISNNNVAVIITGEQNLDTAVKVIRRGVFDFITKPFTISLFNERLDEVIQEWRSRTRYHYYQSHLESLINAMMEKLVQSSEQISRVYDMTVAALGSALDLRDPETEEHCWRVSENSVRLGEAMGLSHDQLRNLKWGAYLHDIGKIGVPENILSKAGDLTAEEMELVKVHPMLGFKMISNIDFLKDATDVVLFHHERYGGSGYPYDLKGEEIPLAARIFAVIDTMDAMIYDRPYRKALPFSALVEELKSKSGSQYDPDVVRVFLEFPESAWRVREKKQKVKLGERIVDASVSQNQGRR
jgi:response regulator RpfG family c-di-GMP phosphodiesterase